MKTRLLAASVLILASATSASQAGPTFLFTAGSAPGQAALYGDAQYSGPNMFNGVVPASLQDGIEGLNTPLNSGKVYAEFEIFFSVVSANSGSFSISSASGTDFAGVVTTSAVTQAGGGFTFTGNFTSAAAAAYFGYTTTTPMAGTASVTLTTAVYPEGIANDNASLTLNFSPSAVPEPSSLILLGTGALGLAGFGLRRAWRAGRPA